MFLRALRLKKMPTSLALVGRGHGVGQRALHCHKGERCLDERRVDFAKGQIYSTVGYADAALASTGYAAV
ncbi:MAG: hypothetical protein QOC89_1202 [Paraburkholderia sp.]|nr:hypothetical protein [Paraburkholderia sp.]